MKGGDGGRIQIEGFILPLPARPSSRCMAGPFCVFVGLVRGRVLHVFICEVQAALGERAPSPPLPPKSESISLVNRQHHQ
jgi:hypothetical protein